METLKRHMRLDPFYVPLAPAWLGLANYAQAIPPLRESKLRAPDLRHAHAWLAATYAQLGELDAAHREAAEVLRIDHTYTIRQAPVIFHDATLVAIAQERPASPDDLAKISGVGQSKLKRYGADVLNVVRAN